MSEHDVLVVGGGVHGCAVAVELAKRGRTVTVLEKSVPGAEASGAAAGILGPHLECEEAGPFLDLCRHSLELYPRWVADLEERSGIDVELVPCGGLFVGEEREALEARAALLAELDVPCELLDRDALRVWEPGLSQELDAGLLIPSEHRAEPRSIMRALAIAARRLDVGFVSETVLGLEPRADGICVRTAAGERVGRDVVLAAGAWSSAVPGSGLPPGSVLPARGQIVMLQFATPPVRSVIFSHDGYVVPRDDGRLFCGSTLEFEGFRKEVTAGGLRSILDLAIRLVPSAVEAPVVDSWAGLRPWTRDQLPLIGRGVHDGLWLATGHYRNGILLAPASATCLAATMCGDTPAVDLHAFGAGRLGSTRTD